MTYKERKIQEIIDKVRKMERTVEVEILLEKLKAEKNSSNPDLNKCRKLFLDL